MKQALINLRGIKAGILTEDEDGYTFQYDTEFLQSDVAEAVSLTLPLTEKAYHDKVLFPFFDGLIPEGWLLDIAEKNWKKMHVTECHCCWRAVKTVSVQWVSNL